MRESGFDHFDPESWEREGKEKRRNEIVIESLAASAAGEACPLRLALAEILAVEDHWRSYGSDCDCSGKGCSGHIPETTKIARAALGLPSLPDRDRVSRAKKADA